MFLEKPALKSTILIDGVLFICVLGFMLSVLWRDAHSPWSFEHKHGSVTDNFYIALNAKNISRGLGWGLYNGAEFVPFEREISTGPVVFLPVVLALQWITDPDDARYVGTIGLNLVLLGVFLWRLKILFPNSNYYRFAWLLIPLLLLSFMREQWYLVLGEVAASLLLVIAASFVANREPTDRQVLISGLLAGMALMSKLISILCSPWMLLFLVVSQWRSQGQRVALGKACYWLAAFCLVPGLVAVWHWAGLGWSWSGLLAYSKDYLSYYFGLGWTGKMESTICLDPDCLAANHLTASTAWMHPYGSFLAYLVAAAPLAVVGSLFRKTKITAYGYLLIISLMCLAQVSFFYFNGIHWQSRYYFIAGFTGMVVVVLFVISLFPVCVGEKFHRPLFVFLLLIALGGSLPWYREAGMTASHRDAREVASYINQSASIHEVLWVNHKPYPFPFVDYYLGIDKAWVHVYGFIGRYFYWNEDKLAIENTFFWREKRNHYVLLEKWAVTNPQELDICDIRHFENQHFSVLECRPDELEEFYKTYTKGRIHFGSP